MSWQAISWASQQCAGSPTGKLILLVVAAAADREGCCHISHKTIAERGEIKRRAVILHMKALEGAGLICRERRNSDHGQRAPDLVQLAMPSASQGARDAPREDQSLSAPRAPRETEAKVHETTRLGAPHAQHKKTVLKTVKRERASPLPRKAETGIPEGFPDDAVIEHERVYLSGKGWNIDAGLEAEKFQAWALANGRTYRDWRAAFHNWMMKAIGYAPASAKVATVLASPSSPAPTDDWRRRLAAYADPANQHWNTTDWGPRPGKPGCRAPAELITAMGLNVVALPTAPMRRPGGAL